MDSTKPLHFILPISIIFLLHLFVQPASAQSKLLEAPLVPTDTVTVCGNIGTNTTWTVDNIYVVDCDVTVNADVVLTIEPGTIVKFNFDDSLYVNGRLIAQGTANEPIYFTSYRDDTVGGDTNGDGSNTLPGVENWGRIQFAASSDDSSIIENAVIRYSGNDGTSSADYGAIRLIQASPILRDIVFEKNFVNGVEVREATWTTDTWDNVGITYFVRADLTIPAGETLTINPGMVIKFDFDDSLFVSGKFIAKGTANQPIYLTSSRDDAVGGDTNNDGVTTLPSVENWGRIQFAPESDDSSIIEHAIIRYSGNDGTSSADYGAIRLIQASPILRNITFEKNFVNGVEIRETTWANDTWDNVGITYYVRADLTIPASETLTIAPGMVIKFGFDDSLFVSGKLMIQGTASQPIYLTSSRDDAVGGDTNNDGGATLPGVENWGRIQFEANSNDDSIIEHAIIRYSGNDGTSSADYGAIRLIQASPILRDITFEKNFVNGVEIREANWATDTWDNVGITYFVRADLTIPAGETLTIAPGMVIKFGFDDSLFVSGKLMIQGTVNQPIYLTSSRDDAVGGDTNNDGGATLPSVENWGRIQFEANSNDDSIIEHTIIRYSGNDGTSSADYGAIRLIQASPILRNISFEKNFVNGVEIREATWATDTWDNVGITYFIRADLTISDGETLTIAPGMVIKFGFDDSLFVSGKLMIQGTASQPIYLTSSRDDTVGGDTNNDGDATLPGVENWGRIQFAEQSDDSSIIEHAVIRYSGNDGTSSVDYGAIRLIQASPILRDITFEKNFVNGVEIREATWNTDTWDNVGITYYIRADLTIPEGQTLTIAPGMVIKFGFDDSLFVSGRLLVQGAVNRPIYLTSSRDDTVGGDTNNDGDATLPGVENWGRIQFAPESDDSSIIEHAVIRYSGNDGTSSSDFAAVRLLGKSIFINNVNFQHNFRGVEVFDGGQPVIFNSSFTDIVSFAVFNDSPETPVNATLNWWGDPSGPMHPELNSAGLGEPVSDGVLFDPWLIATPVGVTRSPELLSLNEIKNGTLTSLNWLDYELELPAGASVLFQVTPQETDHQLWLFGQPTTLPNLALYDSRSTELTARGTYDLLLSPSQAATYYFSVFNRSLIHSPISVEVQAQVLDRYLSDITPKSAGNKGETRLIVSGLGFVPEGMVVELRRAGSPTIAAQEITYLSTTELASQFDLVEQATGLYEVWLLWPGGESEMIVDAFEVTEGIGPVLEATIDVRDVYRPSRSYTGWIEYTNVGDADLPIPLFIISTDNASLLKGECDDAWSESSVQLLGINPETPFGELPPGETHRIPFVFESDSLTLNFQLNSVVGSNEAINWGAYKGVMRPVDVSEAEWDTIWPTLTTQLGSTWTAYVNTLRTNALRLQNRGLSAECVTDLLALEIEQAQGESVAAVTGQLLDSVTLAPITEVDVVLASEDGTVLRSELSAAETGLFMVDALADGTYDIYVSGYEISPTQKIEIQNQTDVTGLTLLVSSIEEDEEAPVQFYSNPQVVNVAGVPHMVFAVNDQFYHTQYEQGAWGQAVKIEGAVGQEPQLRYAANLIDGSQPGMMLSWINGEGNAAEIMYSIAQNQGNVWAWSAVESYATADVSSNNHSVTIDDAGIPIVVWQKVDLTNAEDDTDLYYDNQAVSASGLSWNDIATVIVLAQDEVLTNGTLLTAGTPVALTNSGEAYALDPSELNDWSTSISFDYSFAASGSIPDSVPYFNGKNEFSLDANLTGMASTTGASVNGTLNTKLQLFDDKLVSTGDGAGAINWVLDDQTCRYVFSNANASADITVSGRFPLPSLNHESWWLSVEVGVALDGNLNGQIVWVADPNTKKISSQSSLTAALGLGFYGDIEVLDGAATASLTGTGQFRMAMTEDGFQLTDAFFQYTASASYGPFEWEIEGRYPPESTVVYTSLDEALRDVFSNPATTNVTFSLNSKTGTNKAYSGQTVLTDVTTDLTDDGAPVVVINSDGEVYAFWVRESENPAASLASTIMYAQYVGNSWSVPQAVPNTTGFNNELAAVADTSGQIILVWRGNDATGFNLSSDPAVVLEALETGHVKTAVLDASGIWSTPQNLTVAQAKYRWVSVQQLSNGNLYASWVEDAGSNNRNLHVSTFSSSWSAPVQVTTGDIYGTATFALVGNQLTGFWVQAEDGNKADQGEVTRLQQATYSGSSWSPPQPFTAEFQSTVDMLPNLANRVAQSSLTTTFKLTITPPSDVCEPEEPEEPEEPPTPPPGEQNPEDSDDSVSVRSFDPNEKVGPVGFGSNHIISDTEKLHYTVFFENEPEKATAPAQEVFITDQLDTDLDWATIQFEEVAFGSYVFPIQHEVGELSFYTRQTVSDYRPGNNKVWWVDIIGEINPSTGLVNWSLRMLDPDTNDLPDDAFAGFLPPNDDSGIGEGHVAFTIESADTVEIGTIITNFASIVFDTNEPIITNEVSNIIGVPGYNIFLPLITQ